MTDLTGHFLLFTVVAVVFLILPLIIGRFVRPRLPNAEKDSIYECGEPTIGSSYVQFDLRFYVVALLFIIFDVEVAFFFPWAMVYGGATQLADTTLSEAARENISAKLLNLPPSQLGDNVIGPEAARTLALTGFVDILVFFGVLLVGFAYVWKRGDLDWVRAVSEEVRQGRVRPAPPPPALESKPKPDLEPAGT